MLTTAITELSATVERPSGRLDAACVGMGYWSVSATNQPKFHAGGAVV
jgi:hypothetical protein